MSVRNWAGTLSPAGPERSRRIQSLAAYQRSGLVTLPAGFKRDNVCIELEVNAKASLKLYPVDEFYKKGCQEKSSPSTGRGEDFRLEIQPTACERAPRFA